MKGGKKLKGRRKGNKEKEGKRKIGGNGEKRITRKKENSSESKRK